MLITASEAQALYNRNPSKITEPYVNWAIQNEACKHRKEAEIYGEEIPKELYNKLLDNGFKIIKLRDGVYRITW